MKLILKTFCCCIIALLLLGIALPSIVSLKPVHSRLIQLVNLKIPGKVHLDTLEAGWFSGLEMANLQVADPSGIQVLSVPKITVKEPLYRFLLDRSSLGTVYVEKPSVLLIEDASGDISLKNAFVSSKIPSKLEQEYKSSPQNVQKTAAPSSPKKHTKTKKITPPPQLQLAISDADAQLKQPDSSYTISNLQISLSLEGYDKLHLQLDSDVEHGGKRGSTSIAARATNFEKLNELYIQKLLQVDHDKNINQDSRSPELSIEASTIDFPVSIVDQFLQMANPKSTISLTELLGDSLNSKISHFASAKKIDAIIDVKSPNLTANTVLEVNEKQLDLPQGASVEWIIHPAIIQKAVASSSNEEKIRSADAVTLQIKLLPTAAALPLSSVKDNLPINLNLGFKEPLRLLTKNSSNLLVNFSATATAASIENEINSNLKVSVDANGQRLAAIAAVTLRNIFGHQITSEQARVPQLSWQLNIIGDPSHVVQSNTLPIQKQFTKETELALSGEVADIKNPLQSQAGNAKITGQNLNALFGYRIHDSYLVIAPFDIQCKIHPDLLQAIAGKEQNSQRLSNTPIEIHAHADHFEYPLSKKFSAAKFLCTLSIKPFALSDQAFGSIGIKETLCNLSKEPNKPIDTTVTTSVGLKGAKIDINNLIGDLLEIKSKGLLEIDDSILRFTDANLELKSERLLYKSGTTDVTLRPEVIIGMRDKTHIEFTLLHNSPFLSKNIQIGFAKDPHLTINGMLDKPFVLKEGLQSVSLIGDLSLDNLVPQAKSEKPPAEFRVASTFAINGKNNNFTSDFLLTQNGQKTGSAVISIPLNTELDSSFFTKGKLEKLQLASLFAIANLQRYSSLIGSNLDLEWDVAVKKGDEFDLSLNGKTETLGINTNIFIGQEITPKPHKIPLIASMTISKDRYKDIVRLLAKKDPKFVLDEDFNVTINFSKITFPIQLLKDRNPKEPWSKVLDQLTVSAKVETTKAQFSGVDSKTIALSPIHGTLSLNKNSRLVQFQLASEKSPVKNADWNPVLSITGSFAHIWSETGFGIENAKIQVDAKVQDLPVKAIESFTNDSDTQEKLVALLGKEANAELICTINQLKTGDVILNIDSTNFKAYANAVITNSLLTLKEPLTASLIISSKAGRSILKDINPLLIGAAKTKTPIKITIPNTGVSIPIKDFTVQKITIPKAKIELGQLKVKNGDTLGFIIGLLKLKKLTGEKDMNLWFTPIYLSMSSGVITCSRADALLADSFPIATWGTIDLNRDYVDMVVALHGTALEKALGITRLDPDYMLQMPLKGPTSKPVLDTKRVTARIAAFGIQAIPMPNTLILGGLLEAAASVGEKESTPPPPTTYPFPWTK